MRFLRPDLAHWALAIPLLVLLWIVHRASRAAFRRRAPVASRFAPLSRRSTLFRDLIVLFLGMTMASALVLAMTRPQAMSTHKVPDYRRQDLIIMLDRSVSMQAKDIRPSRAGRAAQEIRHLMRHKPEGLDRVALVGFADSSVILSYLTRDIDSLMFYFDWIDSDPTPLFGTNIGAALTSAMDVARKDDRPTQKVFLILSDGEDFGSELEKSLTAAQSAGIRVHTIGIGTDEAVPIPLRAMDGQETSLRDDTGRALTTRYSERTLRNIASVTGGRYLRSSSGDDLLRAIASIVSGERQVVGFHSFTEYRDLWAIALIVAAAAGAILLWLL
jgi:Ca-activated chloride channel family protein